MSAVYDEHIFYVRAASNKALEKLLGCFRPDTAIHGKLLFIWLQVNMEDIGKGEMSTG